ncbi:MAG: hypothetical protein L6Q66_11915, partial [Bacteroidia bacterium]|nr:hypothetical protein [Bacteroidia bacterium]
MPGRQYVGATGYRYGFNGKESDDEVKGSGNQQDYGMRIYDPRLGKFLSVDPLAASYSMLTPYQFACNSPIDGIDLDGLEHLDANESRIEITTGGVMLKIENMTCLTQRAWKNANNNPDNWTWNEKTGQKDIGISKKIANFGVTAVSSSKPKAEDIQDNPSYLKSQ